MDRKNTPFPPSGVLFALYYLLVPVLLGVMGLPFVGSLLDSTALVYLGLGVVLILRRGGMGTAVFTFVAALLQISPIIYFAGQLIRGAFSLSSAFGLANSLCQTAAFVFLTLFAVEKALADGRFRIIGKAWLLPTLFAAISLAFYSADIITKALAAGGVNPVPLILATLPVVLIATAVSLTGAWYKRIS